MEIHDKHTTDRQRRIDITQSVRESVRKFTAEFEPRRLETEPAEERAGDRIELSAQARELAARESEAQSTEERRRARVEELRVQYREGRLDTPESVERAAGRMLGAD